MYQTQLRSTKFTNKVRFVKGLVNYIENMTLIERKKKSNVGDHELLL